MPEAVWIIFLAVLGGCVGSFLNVVAYRLPRGQSLLTPGSHCPQCSSSIRWFDNVPVLSYLRLRGRCRSCGQTISVRYALVELSTALAFVALYDAFYKSGTHLGFEAVTLGAVGAPVFASHLVLLAGLIVCSVLDIEYYLIDLRIVYVMVVAGLAGWVFGWREGQVFTWPVVGTLGLAGSLGVVTGEAVRRAGVRLFEAGSHVEQAEELSPLAESESAEDEAPEAVPAGVNWQVVLMLFYAALGVGLIVWTAVGGSGPTDFRDRAWGYVGWLFLAILIGCMPHRRSDRQIVHVIEQERSGARGQAVRELAAVLPAVAGGVVGMMLVAFWPAFSGAMDGLLDVRWGGHRPMAGLAAGLCGLVVSVGLGWFVRIFFTLAFGKEAMGVGDIYILAAVGATAGGLAAVTGFFIGSIIGVLGIVLLLLWKTSRALSYGPWIAIGTLVSLLFYNSFVGFFRDAASSMSMLLRSR